MRGAAPRAVRAVADRTPDLLPATARATLLGTLRTQQRRWRRAGRDGVARSVRLAVAAASAHLLALAVFPGSAPLVAALTGRVRHRTSPGTTADQRPRPSATGVIVPRRGPRPAGRGPLA